MNGYTKMCYEQKKYAFLSDYVRLLVVYQNGGLYFDTDVELVRNPDFLLENSGFLGFEINGTDEKEGIVNTGQGFGASANNSSLKLMIDEYQFLLTGKEGVKGCPSLNTQALLKEGLKKGNGIQKVGDFTVYPQDYFNPYESTTGILNSTSNTVSIHWYAGSWISLIQRIRSKLLKPVRRIIKNLK